MDPISPPPGQVLADEKECGGKPAADCSNTKTSSRQEHLERDHEHCGMVFGYFVQWDMPQEGQGWTGSGKGKGQKDEKRCALVYHWRLRLVCWRVWVALCSCKQAVPILWGRSEEAWQPDAIHRFQGLCEMEGECAQFHPAEEEVWAPTLFSTMCWDSDTEVRHLTHFGPGSGSLFAWLPALFHNGGTPCKQQILGSQKNTHLPFFCKLRSFLARFVGWTACEI